MIREEQDMMKKRFAKVTAAGLCAALIGTELAGCGISGTGTGKSQKAGDDTAFVSEQLDKIKLDKNSSILYMFCRNNMLDIISQSYAQTAENGAETETGVTSETAAAETTAAETTAAETTQESVDETSDTATDMSDYSSTYYFNSYKPDGSEVSAFKIKADGTKNIDALNMGDNGEYYVVWGISDQDGSVSSYEYDTYDPEGKKKTACAFDTASLKSKGMDISNIYNIYCSRSGDVFISDDKNIGIVSKNGKCTAVLQMGKEQGSITAECTDGSVLYITYDKNGTAQMQTIDKAASGFSDKIDFTNNVSAYTFQSGDSRYDLYSSTNSGIYGYSVKNKACTKLLDWVDSDVNGTYVGSYVSDDNGGFYCAIGGDQGGDVTVCHMTKSTADEGNVTELTLAGAGINDSVMRAVVAYNKSQSKYRIKVRDYGDASDPGTAMSTSLMSGDVPDIIDLSTIDKKQYIAKGMIEDLLPYIDKDKEIKQTDFFPSVLKALETDGKLYQVCPEFSFNMFVANKKITGDKRTWTTADLQKLTDSLGKGTVLYQNTTSMYVMEDVFTNNPDEFINWSTGKCGFDTDSFKTLMKYAKDNYPEKLDENSDGSIDGATTDDAVNLKSGRLLASLIYGVSPDQIEAYHKMLGDDMVIRSGPDSSGIALNAIYSLGMYSKSKNKEAVWDFLRTFLSKDYGKYKGSTVQYLYGTSFPLRKDLFDWAMKRYTTTQKYTDVNGDEVEPLDYQYAVSESSTIDIKPLSDEEVGIIKTAIGDIDHESGYDADVVKILEDESGAYFSGQKSLDDVTKVIQNRVSTYVNENR